MSESQQILDERLAKGEITEDEFERLKNKLSSSDGDNKAEHPASITVIAEGKRALGKILLTAGGILCATLTAMWLQINAVGGTMAGVGRLVWFLSAIVAFGGLYLIQKNKNRN